GASIALPQAPAEAVASVTAAAGRRFPAIAAPGWPAVTRRATPAGEAPAAAPDPATPPRPPRRPPRPPPRPAQGPTTTAATGAPAEASISRRRQSSEPRHSCDGRHRTVDTGGRMDACGDSGTVVRCHR